MSPTTALAAVLACGVVSGAIRAWRDVLVLRRLERLMTGCTARQRAEVARAIAGTLRHRGPSDRPGLSESAETEEG
ncbi:hypothetical protein AB0C76_21470 [Kitasatospora sp. NPDC048722]|uniref:hypothetical protein n=1 Tax=Kitasatospora sp. NPDC048722 TaxID=3155639 RepID=UPI0033F19456